jgi:Ferritin-like domain
VMRTTRRGALLAGAAALTAPALARADVTGDAAVLGPIHRTEMFALAAYGTAAMRRAPALRAAARRFQAHEAKHVAALATALEALGAPRFPPPRGVRALDAEARRLGIAPVFSALRTTDEVLAFLLAVEEHLVRAWVDAPGRLDDEHLVQLATEVLACQAQHLVVLREALGRPQLPDAFETGAS